MDPSSLSSVAPRPPAHSGLGVASCLFAALTLGVLSLAFNAVLKTSLPPAAVANPAAALGRGLAGLALIGALAVAVPALLIGLGLGVAGLTQRDRRLLFPILGTVFNGSLLTTLSLFLVLGIVGVRHAVAARRRALAALTPAGAAGQAAPGRPAFADEIERQTAASTSAGYEPVLVADLAADPARFENRKVAFSGFYSGTGLEPFAVYGVFGGGGVVWADGAALPPRTKKALILGLDGFHKIFVRGTFKSLSLPPRRPGLPAALFKAQTRVFADEIVDLGRVADPAAEPRPAAAQAAR